MTDTATPATGTVHDVDSAADALVGLFGAKEPPEKTQEQSQDATPEAKAEPEQTDASETQAEEATPETKSPLAELQSLDDLAKALEVDQSELSRLKVKAKIEGKESEVTLEEALRGYQREADYTQKTMELADQRKAFETERQARQALIEKSYQDAQVLTQYLEEQAIAEYKAVDWNKLRATDPAEYAIRRQEAQEKANQIQYLKARVGQDLEARHKEAAAEQESQYQEWLKKEAEMIPVVIPDWKDSAKRSAEAPKIRDYLVSNGVTPDQLKYLSHKELNIARKAWLYDQMQNKASVKEKQVVTLPKVLKPSAQPAKNAQANEALKERMARLRKSGRVEDAADIIAERMFKRK